MAQHGPTTPAQRERTGFWHTLPGVLTAVATFIGAITGLIAAVVQIGVFGGDDGGTTDATASLQVLAATVRADPATARGGCPVTVTFTADLQLSGGAGTLTYRWVWDDRPDSDERVVEVTAGETRRTIEYQEQLGQPVGLRDRLIDDEVGIEILSPSTLSSTKVDVTVDCR